MIFLYILFFTVLTVGFGLLLYAHRNAPPPVPPVKKRKPVKVTSKKKK